MLIEDRSFIVRCQMTRLILLHLSAAFWSWLTRSYCWANFYLWKGELRLASMSRLFLLQSCRGMQSHCHTQGFQLLFFCAFYKRGEGLGQLKATHQPTDCESVMSGQHICIQWILQNGKCLHSASHKHVRETEHRQHEKITFSGQDKWWIWVCLSCNHLAENC